ncbi:MAG: hypothetical protein EBZ06_12980 [Betaproteobacteria bacterium]|nr:hypothetical protein [Betaproteobacteria bacterium]
MNRNRKYSEFMRQVKLRVARRNAEAYWIASNNEAIAGNIAKSDAYAKMAKHQDNLAKRYEV